MRKSHSHRASAIDDVSSVSFEGCSIKTENNFEKIYIFWNYSVFTTTPSSYSPLSATHFTQRFCHSSNTCWNPFCAKRLKGISAAPNAACGDARRRPMRSLLPAEKRKKSLGCKEFEESRPHHARSRSHKHTVLHVVARYCDTTSIDHYDNVATYMGYAL